MKKWMDNTLVKFMIVGIINTVTGAAIMFGLYNLAGCSYWVSSASNYILVSILSFFLNKKFTFRSGNNTGKSALRFAVHICLCYLIAYGFAEKLLFHFLAEGNPVLRENLAMAAGMCIFTGINYLGQRFFVFGKSVL